MTAKQALQEIKEKCEANPYVEVCGFLGYDKNSGKFVVSHEENIAEDPRLQFMINPLNYILFKEDFALVAIYHSHISEDESPSEFDVKMSNNCCEPFLIYSLRTKKNHIYEPQNVDLDVNTLEKVKEQL